MQHINYTFLEESKSFNSQAMSLRRNIVPHASRVGISRTQDSARYVCIFEREVELRVRMVEGMWSQPHNAGVDVPLCADRAHNVLLPWLLGLPNKNRTINCKWVQNWSGKYTCSWKHGSENTCNCHGAQAGKFAPKSPSRHLPCSSHWKAHTTQTSA